MAERAYNRRRVRPSCAEGHPPTRRDERPDPKPVGASLPLTLIDLDAHPDAALLRACAQATKLRDNLEIAGYGPYEVTGTGSHREFIRLTFFIIKTEALTQLGVTMKALFVLSDKSDPMQFTLGEAPFVSVIRDFLRMGVAA